MTIKTTRNHDTKELIFSGSDYRVILWLQNYKHANVRAFELEADAREYFNSLDACEVVSAY